MRPARRVLSGAIALLIAAVVVGCGEGEAPVSRADEREVEEAIPAAEAEDRGAATPPAATSTPAAPPLPTATSVPGWTGEYAVGTCFDTADGGRPGARLDCAGTHENEVFLQHGLDPSVPYPADLDAFVAAVLTEVCEPAVIQFGGEPVDRLPLRVAVRVPTEAQWIAGDRMALCVAQSALPELPTMIGTAAGGTLDSNEGIVARATVDGQRDWFYSFEGSSLHRLTTGDFNLANTSPQVLDTSLSFAASARGADASQARGYVFDSETGAITDVLPDVPAGWEIASLHVVADREAYVFAARTSPADDWDIYRSESSGEPVALTENEVDDRWPTVTPDGAQIVFHSDGDIWIMNADGSDKRQLTDDRAGDYESAVSPDGTRIAFVLNRSGNDDVWLMNIDGGDQTNLTAHPAGEAWPFWSADGSIIYFQSDRLGANATIMMMETDGANQSYYSYELLTNGAVLPAAVSARYAAELPPLE